MYNISDEQYKECCKQWKEIRDSSINCNLDDIRNKYKNDITNDMGDCLDMNYKDILVTFYDRGDGKAKLIKKMEYYNKEGVFIGYYDVLDSYLA